MFVSVVGDASSSSQVFILIINSMRDPSTESARWARVGSIRPD